MQSIELEAQGIESRRPRAVSYSVSRFTFHVSRFTFYALPVFGLLYLAFTSYGALTERVYGNANGITGELLRGHSVGQTFVSRYAGLSGVSLWLGTYGDGARASAV